MTLAVSATGKLRVKRVRYHSVANMLDSAPTRAKAAATLGKWIAINWSRQLKTVWTQNPVGKRAQESIKYAEQLRRAVTHSSLRCDSKRQHS